MYIRRLKLKNYRLFNEVDVSFQHGMNVLIGKNSTGKSAILEAIDFLLSNDNANIPEEEIIPYSKRNDQSVNIRINGIFAMSDLERAGICSILDDADDRSLVANSNMEIIYTKTITKSGKNIRIDRNIQTNGNGISNRPDIITRITNSLLPKLQTNNAIRITDADANNGASQLLPLNQLAQMAPRQSNFLYQYVRNALYDMKQNSAGEFNKIKAAIINAYPEMSDMDVEFDPKRAQVRIYFISGKNGMKIPLEGEGLGILEFFYLLLTLFYFQDTVILKDEALTHMHKSLLNDFIVAIDGLRYQMITTSHIKELIKALDFGNIITCRKCNGETVVKNLMQLDEIDNVLDELGYPVDIVPDFEALV